MWGGSGGSGLKALELKCTLDGLGFRVYEGSGFRVSGLSVFESPAALQGVESTA